MRKRIAVIMGGTSSEREISLRSGAAILKSLLRQDYDAYSIDINSENEVSAFIENDFDLAFMALHGGNGENGKIQSLLDLLGKKYTGSGQLASAIAINKELTKKIADRIGIRIIKTYKNIDEIESYPVMIKPNQDGSSIGIHKCENFEDAKKAVEDLKADYIIEEFIDGIEITSGVLDGKSLGVVKIIPVASKIYDYESKYAQGGSIHECPAKVSEKVYAEAMKFAEEIHQELNLTGVSRSDFLVKDEKCYFLEVNTTPGMTETSLIPDLLKYNGCSFDEFTKMMVEKFFE